jgi:flagellar hook-basal body complex protein FliE
MQAHRTIASTIGILAVSAALLSGCSVVGAAVTQNKTAACAVLASDMRSASTELSSAFSQVASDPAAGEAALASFATKLEASVKKVSNTQVKASAQKAVDSVKALDAELKKYTADPSDTAALDALQADAKDVQSTFGKLGSLCEK